MPKIKLSEYATKFVVDTCKSFDNKDGELINVLHKVQHEFGYLPLEVQVLIAQELNMPVAKVYGVVTFYSFFNMKPQGDYPISICTGTACYVRGSEAIVDEFKRVLDIEVGETSEDGLFTLNCLRCVGACGLAPVVLVGEKVHGRVTTNDVKKIVAEYRQMAEQEA